VRTYARTLTFLSHPPLWGAAALVAGFVVGRTGARRHGTDPDGIGLITQEQAALRRVTTLAAGGAAAAEIFDAVAGEMGRIVGADYMIMCRFHRHDSLLVVASWSSLGPDWRLTPIGLTWPIPPYGVTVKVMRTGRPARAVYTAEQAERVGFTTRAARERPFRSSVGCPITVEGRRWGVLITFSVEPGTQPEGVEERMVEFLELATTAIANAESRAELAASRARVVAAADASRRRIERDLHDGAQQRIVRLALWARGAAAAVPPVQAELGEQLSDMAAELTGILDDLREICRGLHPTILSHGGLRPALETLARRSVVPVRLDLRVDGRFPDTIEVAAYHVVAEALTNTAKHAGASEVRVGARVQREAGHRVLRVTIRDDGAGGAELDRGSGLIGLRDRIEVLGGRLDISSPAGGGTTLVAGIPVEGGSSHPAPDG
jgi:signal transduction histidine kinase